MPAQYDRSQKIAFVYSNLYHIYRKGVQAAKHAPEFSGSLADPLIVSKKADKPAAAEALVERAKGYESGRVLKVGNHNAAPAAVQKAEPKIFATLIHDNKARRTQDAKPASNPAIAQMKGNLQSLNEMQAKLRFLLKELEDMMSQKS